MLWKVRVRQTFEKGTKYVDQDARFLIEAPNSTDAMLAGEKYAEDTARVDLRLIKVQAREAAAIQLPFELK